MGSRTSCTQSIKGLHLRAYSDKGSGTCRPAEGSHTAEYESFDALVKVLFEQRCYFVFHDTIVTAVMLPGVLIVGKEDKGKNIFIISNM